jgi:hypothetical protein
MTEKQDITHIISKEDFELVKPWSNQMLRPEAIEKTLIVPSLDGRNGIPFEIIDEVKDGFRLREILDLPRLILNPESAQELAIELLKLKFSYNSSPQYVETYIHSN